MCRPLVKRTEVRVIIVSEGQLRLALTHWFICTHHEHWN